SGVEDRRRGQRRLRDGLPCQGQAEGLHLPLGPDPLIPREDTTMADTVNLDRRPVLSAGLGLVAAAAAPKVRAQAASFGPLKQIDAGGLNVGYAEAGPTNGAPVLLLHGWPYDIHSYFDVAPVLAASGFRVIVPYLRGYG